MPTGLKQVLNAPRLVLMQKVVTKATPDELLYGGRVEVKKPVVPVTIGLRAQECLNLDLLKATPQITLTSAIKVTPLETLMVGSGRRMATKASTGTTEIVQALEGCP